MIKLFTIPLLFLFSNSCFSQSASIKMNSKNRIYVLRDSITILINYQNIEDTSKASISAEVFLNKHWREFDNDIFSKEDKVFNYKYLNGSGTIVLKAAISDIMYNLREKKRKIRLVLNYQPYRYNPLTHYFNTKHSNWFIVK